MEWPIILVFIGIAITVAVAIVDTARDRASKRRVGDRLRKLYDERDNPYLTPSYREKLERWNRD